MRITKEEKREIWLKREEDCRASGLTIPAYCAPKGITVPSFYPWRKSVGDSEAPPAEETQVTEFLPVTWTPVHPPARSPMRSHGVFFGFRRLARF